jgi:hypothetical protein
MSGSAPQFPDPLGFREVERPGATAHKAGRDLIRRVDALEQGAASRTLRTKAGIPSDADYSPAPPIGTMVIDITNNRLYIRTAAATWKYTGLT